MRGQVSVMENPKLASEKPNYATIVASNPMVDEKIWNAISVGEPEAAINFRGATVYDETDVIDYGMEDFPVEIPWGHVVSVSYRVQNVGDVVLAMRLLVEFIDPLGNVLDSLWEPTYGTFKVSPGPIMSSKRTAGFELNQAGIWTIHGLAEFDIA